MRNFITREEAIDMADAHGEGLHAELPRDFCPECTGRDLSSYPLAKHVEMHDELLGLINEEAVDGRKMRRLQARSGRHVGYLTSQPSGGHGVYLRDSRRAASKSQYQLVTYHGIDRLEIMGDTGRYKPISKWLDEQAKVTA